MKIKILVFLLGLASICGCKNNHNNTIKGTWFCVIEGLDENHYNYFEMSFYDSIMYFTESNFLPTKNSYIIPNDSLIVVREYELDTIKSKYILYNDSVQIFNRENGDYTLYRSTTQVKKDEYDINKENFEKVFIKDYMKRFSLNIAKFESEKNINLDNAFISY